MSASEGNMGGLVRRFSAGWKTRHLVTLLIAAAGTYLFLLSRAEWSEMHRWNRAIGDMSLVMVAFSMAIGPLSRLLPRTRAIIPWRREFGIYGVFLAIIHTAIILVGWVQWDLMRLFGYEMHPEGMYVMLQHGFGLANAIGIAALLYGIVLALASSNWSQRLLGGTVWKYLQQSAYVLWMLIVVHTAYFLYLHFQDFHRNTPEPNWAQIPFAVLVLVVIALQLGASYKTWKLKRNRAAPDQFETPLEA
ncbi:FIG01026394: hypothetical protein [hydrothermal vent metagenome]|uniref:Ferric oxidoreductase domain-containing protein n=1 Tax=hydrothermal vent metagenome TaxID=652676 RepID=A0A3B0SX06_9ZZZZ